MDPRKLFYLVETGRAGGDRTHDRGIMRWLQTVGLVRWGRIHPDSKENLSGGVGFGTAEGSVDI